MNRYLNTGGLLALSLAFCLVIILCSSSKSNAQSIYFSTAPSWRIVQPPDSQCTALVPVTTWEPRPENATANTTVPNSGQLASFHATPINFANGPQIVDFATVTGNYTGTTDMIMRWAACKWGIDENIARADAWNISNWVQSDLSGLLTVQASCSAGNWNGWNVAQSYCWSNYGVTQINQRNYNTSPMAQTSTAFNEDVRWAAWRACMQGDVTLFDSQTPVAPNLPYPNTNLNSMVWGCIGSWYSGDWYSSTAISAINQVQAALAAQPWLTSPVPSGMIITAPIQGATVTGNAVSVTIAAKANDPNVCFTCLVVDSVQKTCTPSAGPWTWDTTVHVPNGSHSVEANSFTCGSVGPMYHSSVNVTVSNVGG